MNYRLLPIQRYPFTRHFLSDVYVLENGNQTHEYGCAPNGEIGISIVVQGEAFINCNGQWIKQPAVSIYGLVNQVQFHKMSPGYREINIGFAPEYLQLILKERVSDLKKRQANILSEWMQPTEVSYLFEKLAKALNDDEILRIINHFLRNHYLSEKPDKRLLYCLEKIRTYQVKNVESLSYEMKLSASMLRNLFQYHVGISPKELIKIHRIKSVLKQGQQKEENYTQLALSLGYYDQSHFIHDFKNAIGLTPSKYFSNNKLISDFYNFQRWQTDSFADEKNI
jgi:AraC-like DNA-binding protein